MQQSTATTLDLRASDVTGQLAVKVEGVSKGSSVAELLSGLLARMRLVREDASGRPLTYRARLEREGRQLLGTEQVGESLRQDDAITIVPHITAG